MDRLTLECLSLHLGGNLNATSDVSPKSETLVDGDGVQEYSIIKERGVFVSI